MQNEAAPVLGAEEKKEAARHDAMYRDAMSGGTQILVPDDWERFDNRSDPQNPYFESVKWLGDVRGRRVLDVGCGTGWFSVILARRGAALVEGFDISTEAVRAAELTAASNGVSDRCRFRVASAYDIPWPDGAFERVAGQAILHHVRDKTKLAQELHRVMAPGARAVFHEPLGNSTVAERLRWLIPVRSQADDPDHWKDKIKYDQLDPFRELFSVRYQEFEFLYWLARLFPRAGPSLRTVDGALLRWIKPLRRYARAIVIELVKRDTNNSDR
jgi:SAM-dependent methyltransferase